MNIKECYEQFGGDYDGLLRRLGKEERIKKYIDMFLKGNDYQLIENSLSSGAYEEAFRNTHNLKGVSLNIGLTPLSQKAEILCEALRPSNSLPGDSELKIMLEDVRTAYDNVRFSLEKID